MNPDIFEKTHARKLDREDPLGKFRKRFHVPGGKIYFDGNSLGLMPADGQASLERVAGEWKSLGIGGWLDASQPWFYFAEKLGARMAPLVGAEAGEVIAAGTTTVNIHALVSSFFHPSGNRNKILTDTGNFPSDIYALKSQLLLHGLDPATHLLTVPPEEDLLFSEDRIIDAMSDEIALLFLPSVLFRTGQLLDTKKLAGAARERGILIGLDCSHSAGVVNHRLSEEGIDFATWCGYKYLNGGPGSTAFVYINSKHFNMTPALTGWFGYRKERQFDMNPEFVHQPDAGGWQISTPNLLSMAPLEGSLNIFEEAGMEHIREKSKRITSYLIDLADHYLSPYGFFIRSPREEERRGGHVALAHPEESWRICQAMKARGIVPDYRPPDIIRLAPVPLYNSYSEVWEVVRVIMEIVEIREHERYDTGIHPVS